MKLTNTEQQLAATLSRKHNDIRIYRSAGGIILSRNAMHSGSREQFWIRFPNTPRARSLRRRGLLVGPR